MTNKLKTLLNVIRTIMLSEEEYRELGRLLICQAEYMKDMAPLDKLFTDLLNKLHVPSKIKEFEIGERIDFSEDDIV